MTKTGKIVAAFIVFAGILAAASVWYLTRPPSEPKILTVAAGPIGSDAHTLMRQIAEVVERHSNLIRLDVRESRNSSVNVSQVNAGEVDLATVKSNTPPVTKIRFIADLFPDYFLLITRRDLPIFTVNNLQKHRIAVPESGSSELMSFWAVIDHYKLPPTAFRFIPADHKRAADMFLHGNADAVFFVSSIRDPHVLSFIEEAYIRNIDLRIIPIEQAQAMSLKRPFISSATIAKGAFNGLPTLPVGDITTAALHRLLVAREGVDPAAINELTRILFENRLDLVVRMPLTSAISGPTEDRSASLPLHAGAQQYYDRNQPSFLQENAEPIALIITVFAMIGSALLALRRSINNRQKNRADVHNHKLLELMARARAADSLETLRGIRAELFDVMEQVVVALDADKVTEEGFQSFSLLWETVRSTTRDRRNELEKQEEHVKQRGQQLGAE